MPSAKATFGVAVVITVTVTVTVTGGAVTVEGGNVTVLVTVFVTGGRARTDMVKRQQIDNELAGKTAAIDGRLRPIIERWGQRQAGGSSVTRPRRS